jgi:hypothetical protein
MSLGGRLRYRKQAKGKTTKSTMEFKVEGKLDPADWAEFLEKFKALLKHYDIKLTKKRD